MIKQLLLGAVAPFLFAAGTAAQSYNIDIHESPSVPPPQSYPGFAGQPGVWNNLPAFATAPVPIVDPAGVSTGSRAWFSVSPAGSSVQPGIPAPHTELYEDFAATDSTAQLTIDNLAAGNYVAVVYSWYPNTTTQFTLTAGGAPQTDVVQCQPPFPGHKVGVTLRQFQFSLAVQSSITIDFTAIAGEGGVINGVQLAHYIGTPSCANQPLNSKDAVPAIIATGNPAANTLVLHAGLLPGPGQLPDGIGAILCFASNNAGTLFPQTCPNAGVRCIGNPVTRVWDPNALPGTGGVGVTTGAGTYDLPIDLPSLAALGLNVAPGATLHFQMIYRDLDKYGLCGATTGSVGRWTQAVSIQL
ncbi:MAG: hypothetical protein KDC98_18275 [Planctomycetes bacterium]|nr:hypothetical protein [Planctomycetota bacterium]